MTRIHLRTYSRTIALLPACIMAASFALSAQEPDPEHQDWRLILGRTVRAIRQQVPTVSRVVLVRDEATYLAELSRWTLDARWPVLFEDDVHALMFIRRFQPLEILLADPVPDTPAWETLARAERESRIQAVLSAAWTSPDEGAPILQRAAGVVLTSLNDPAWCAAVALAADRGQPLGYLEGGYAGPSAALPHDRFADLNQKVEQAVKETGKAYHVLGDEVDAVTIARGVAGRYRSSTDPKSDLLATTDGLCRNADGTRWAVAGWLFGSREFTVYQAMCSIFLTHESALLFNTYPQSEPWNVYGMDKAALALQEAGLAAVVHVGMDAQLDDWLGLSPGGLRSDLVMSNTKGMRHWADMNGGSRAYAQDMPVLDFPTAVYFIHSWSTMLPDQTDTLAGRWLNHGAYAYVGSMSEPYLQAFLPPRMMTARLLAGMPFLVAARQIESKPWKVNTIGDPLFTLLPPGCVSATLDPGTCPLTDDRILSLRTLLVEKAQLAQESNTGWDEVIRLACLVGPDILASKFALAVSREGDDRNNDAARAPAPSHLVLAAHCRVGSLSDVLEEACRIMDAENGPDALTTLELDMIWARVIPELEQIHDADTLGLLTKLVRKPHDFVDAARLAHRYHQLRMDDEARQLVIAARPTADDAYAARLLEKALTE